MQILLHSNQLKIDENTLFCISSNIEQFCKKLDFSIDYIEEIIFADENVYGEVIKNINPEEGYTNTQEGKGFGKTIYLCEKKKNIIILRSEYFQLIVQILSGELQKGNPVYEMTLFTLLHEIGHCISNINEYNEIPKKKTLKIDDIPLYYFAIIYDEYTANKNILMFVNKEWVLYEIENNYLFTLNELYAKMLSFRDIEFVENIWFYIKLFLDIGYFLTYIDKSEYINILNKIDTYFDLNIIISSFQKYDNKEISKQELFNIINNIVNDILLQYYKAYYSI